LLIRTRCIDNAKKIWWDIRPHPHFPTLEFRVCDMPTRMDDTLAIAALCQAIIAKLFHLHERNLTFRHYGRALIMENKWRAARYGIEGKLIDFGKQSEVPVRDLIREILDFVAEAAEELGTTQELGHIEKILKEGTAADRALRVYADSNDLNKVVDQMIQETEEGVPESADASAHASSGSGGSGEVF
jgi:carboxylate-amine ligase